MIRILAIAVLSQLFLFNYFACTPVVLCLQHKHVCPKWQCYHIVQFCVSNLVDPASSYMLVSKIKPCMCKCKISESELQMAH
jgi:hypothetical protein